MDSGIETSENRGSSSLLDAAQKKHSLKRKTDPDITEFEIEHLERFGKLVAYRLQNISNRSKRQKVEFAIESILIDAIKETIIDST